MMKKLNHKEARDSNIQYIWTTISFISCQVKIELMNSKALCVYTIYPKYCSKSFSHKVKGLETRKDPILILPSLHFKIKALIGKYKEGPKYENEWDLELYWKENDEEIEDNKWMFISDEEAPGGKHQTIKIPNLVVSKNGLNRVEIDENEEDPSENMTKELKNLLLFRFYFKKSKFWILRYNLNKDLKKTEDFDNLDYDLSAFILQSIRTVNNFDFSDNNNKGNTSTKSLRNSARQDDVEDNPFKIIQTNNLREPLSLLVKKIENNREIEFYESMHHKDNLDEDFDEDSESDLSTSQVQKQNQEVVAKLLQLLSS